MSENALLYEPLDSKSSSIRLVTIEPGEFQDEIRCYLRTVLLDSCPAFEALSYVWGDPNITRPISLNGQPFQVTVNLESAIRHLRSSTPRTFWIDAICVNQSNIPERNSQVQLMAKIYQRTTGTIIWLGPSTVNSMLAFTFLRGVEIRGLPFGELWNDTIAFEATVSKLNHNLIGHEWSGSLDYVMNSLDDILYREWWERIWVVQEVSMSKKAFLQCGADEFSWMNFVEIVVTFLESICFKRSIYLRCNSRFFKINQMEIAALYWMTGNPLPLWKLLVSQRTKLATDARDMVYALLPLASHDKAETPLLMKPDYSISVTPENVYRELVISAILNGKCLDIICLTHAGTNWPSWIPDWRRSKDLELLLPLKLWLSNVSNTSSFSFFEASSSIKPTVFISDKNPRELKVTGIQIDNIQKISPSFHSQNNFSYGREVRELETLVCSHFRECPDSTRIYTHNVTEISERYRQILGDYSSTHTAECLNRPDTSNKVAYIGGGTVAEAYLQTLLLNIRPDGKPKSIDAFEKWLWKDEQPDTNAWVRWLHFKYRLVISEKGYLGIVPPHTQAGDIVCVLFGCSMPVILRKAENHYIFIGESYVHGIMDGEAIQQMNEGLFKQEVFALH